MSSKVMSRLVEVAESYNLDIEGLFRKCGILHNPFGLEGRAVDMRIKTLQRIMDVFPDININYVVSGRGPLRFDDYQERKHLNEHLEQSKAECEKWRSRYYSLYDEINKEKCV